MNVRKFTLTAIAIGLISASASSMASGSFNSRSTSGAQDPYNFGKITLHRKLLCDSCAMAGTSLTKTNAESIVDKINANSQDIHILGHKERKAVAFYINKRFNIQ